MPNKSFVLFFFFLPFVLISCASVFPYMLFSQHTLDKVDSQLIDYLKANQINYRDVSLPEQHSGIQKLQVRIAVVIESSRSLGKFPNAEELFYQSIISVLSHYFVEVKQGGIIANKQSVPALINKLQQSGELDAILVVSDIMPDFEADNINMHRSLTFTCTFKDIADGTVSSKALIGYRGDKTDLDLATQKQLLIRVILNSAHELENYLIKQIEEKPRRIELLAKLKAKQEQFLQYGFDILDFINYAKATLKTKGEINFGGAIPEIDFRTFKEKLYLEVKINYLVTYNTLKVSMYDAASMTFDEVVAKLARKLSTDFKKQDEIAGFIFNVTYTNKDFLEKYDMPRNVTNEFILPKDACRKYTALDITNQDLINQSIILVDGERISLNLQFSK